MDRATRSILITALCLSLAGLAACNGIPGSESGDVPPQRPLNTVSGYVVDDAVGGALLNVYGFDDGVKGELLASTTTAQDGGYSLQVDGVERRLLLLEARGGEYIELATGQRVELEEDQVLKALAVKRPGQSMSVMVTPLTHLTAALVRYYLDSGMAVEAAIDTATAELNELFGIDVAAVPPRSITEQGTSELTPDYLYGFFLSALSSWTKRVNEQNGLAPHAVYTSIALSQVLYDEVAADGLLDGRAGNALALGTVGLGPNAYRLSLAQHMLAMAAGNANLSGISVEQLLPLAFRLVNSEHRLFAGVAPDLSGGQVAVSGDENLGSYRSGVFEYAVTLDSPELISSVRFSVDDFDLPVAAVPGEMRVPIDTRQFADGQHTVAMRALDWLGNPVANHAIVFQFDNTLPYVNVSSRLYTNQLNYLLSGTVGDNGSGILQFEIDAEAVSINPDNSWSLARALQPGNNPVAIRLEDWAGNSFAEQVTIVLDQTPPQIDSGAGHSQARFIQASELVNGMLADSNTDVPVYIETRRADLDGTAITRAALDGAGIPYFAFAAIDVLDNGVATGAAELQVRMRYEKNGITLADWRPLTPLAGEYLVPLAGETLHSSWHQSLPTDEHGVRVEVRDKAGNRVEKLFAFRAAFAVAGIEMEHIREPSAALFESTAFVDRAALHDRDVSALTYTFTNTSGKAFYIQLDDAGGHVARRDVEQLLREHKVRQVTTPMWRVGVIENASDLCIGSLVNRRFEMVNEIYQFDGNGWVKAMTPPATIGEPINVFSDAPEPPEDSQRVDVDLAAVFDELFASNEISSANQSFSATTTYDYDYLLNVTSQQGLSQPVLIRNWQRLVDYVDTSVDDELTTCIVVPYFKQFERYTYQSEPGYPLDSRSFLEEQQHFATAGFTVHDETRSENIAAVSGWYRIPAGHTVRITKHVHTPALTVDNDVAVAEPDTVADYTPLLYDKAISWSIDRALNITAVHDAGAGNIFAMTPTQTRAGEGAVQYSIRRP